MGLGIWFVGHGLQEMNDPLLNVFPVQLKQPVSSGIIPVPAGQERCDDEVQLIAPMLEENVDGGHEAHILDELVVEKHRPLGQCVCIEQGIHDTPCDE